MCADGEALNREYPFEGACGILKHLRQPADFPILADGEEVYRLIFQPSFHPKLAITVRLNETTSGAISVHIAERLSAGSPAQLDYAADLTAADVAQFRAGPTVADFWATPRSQPEANQPPVSDDEDEWITVCADGAQTIVEGWTAVRYHVAHQHCDDVKGLKEISIAMMRLAEAKFRELPMYWAYEYY
jgi:hypothetical protein